MQFIDVGGGIQWHILPVVFYANVILVSAAVSRQRGDDVAFAPFFREGKLFKAKDNKKVFLPMDDDASFSFFSAIRF